jgi:hypothetical protein
VCFCERALYCSKHCQLAAWGDHKEECDRLREAKEKETKPRMMERDAEGRWVPEAKMPD